MLAFRKYYFKDKWNILDLVIVILSIVDVVVDVYTDGAMGSFSPSVLKLAKICRILRMGRLLKLLKVSIIPSGHIMVKRRPNNFV